jgi:putative MATE family efflux protein
MLNLEKNWMFLQKVNPKKTEVETKTIHSLFTVGIPIMIQYMLTASIGLIASILAGHLGDRSVAALGIGNQIFFVYSLIVLGLFAGSGVLMAQLFGTGDLDNIRRIIIISGAIGFGVACCFLGLEKTCVEKVASIFTADKAVIKLVKSYMDAIIYSYLLLPVFLAFSTGFRSTKRSGKPMLISLVAVIFNVVLTYGLIYGNLGMPELGIAGVGVATVASRTLEMILMVLMAQRSNLAIGFKDFATMNTEIIGLVLKTATPVVINELCWGMGMVLYNILYGYIGLEALTAIQMNSVLQNFFMTLVFGAAGATAIIIGNNVGAGNKESAMEASKTIINIAVPTSILTGLAMISASHLIMPLYKVSAQTANSFLTIAFIAGIMMPVKFYAVLMITGVLRGGGDTVYTMYLELATMWLVGVPLAFVAVKILQLPVYMAFGLVFVEDILKCILTYERYYSQKWITNLTTALS